MPETSPAPKLPGWLSHYTDLPGLIGIVDQGVIRASNVAYLNDREELLHGVRCARKALDRIVGNSRLADWAEPIETVVAQIESGRMPDTYAACFCEKADLLSQWRGYGGGEQGVAIQFSRTGLEELAGAKGRYLAPVEYGVITARSRINTELKARLAELSDEAPEGAVYHLLATPGQVTDIALQPGEVLGAVAAGDTARWVIGDTASGSGDSKRTHVLVKPFAPGLSTNIVITTDRRTYHLALTSADRVAMVALSWTYPQDALIAFKAAQERAVAAQPVASGVQVDQLHFNYVVSGDEPAWRPLRAFDDGRQTFIEFPPSLSVGEAPPLFLVDANGTTTLVNYRVHGRFYVVDRLFDAAELRLGLKHQDVVRISRVPHADLRRAS